MQDLRQPSIPSFSLPQSEYPLSQMEYEFDIQKRAGYTPNTDVIDTRRKAADSLREADEEIYNNSIENSLVSGDITPEGAVAFDSVYEAPERDVNTSLETVVADNELAEAYQWEPGKALSDALNLEDLDNSGIVKAILDQRFNRSMEAYFADSSMWEVIPQMVSKGQAFVSEFSEQLPGDYSLLFTSKKDAWDKLFEENRNKSPEEYARFLDSFSQWLKSIPKADAMNMYFRGSETKDYGENTFTALDLVTLGTAGIAKAAGNVTKSTAATSKAIESGSKAAAISEGLPTAVKGSSSKKISWHNSQAHAMSDGRYIHTLDKIVEEARTTSTVIDEDELDILMDAARRKIQESAAPSLGDVVDYRLSDTAERGEAGEWLYHAVFGPSTDGEGGGFVTEQMADSFAKNRLNLTDGQYSVYKAPGDGSGYYVDVVQGISEDPLRGLKTGAVEDFKTKHKGLLGAFERWTAGSTVRSAEEHKRSIEASRKSSVVQDKLNEHIAMVKASKADEEAVDAAFKHGHELNEGMGKWLTEDELDSLGLTDKQKKLYTASRDVYDTSYAINNDAAVRELTAKGFGQDADGMIVREVNPTSVTHDMFDRMVIMAEDKKLTPNNISGAKALELIKTGDYKLYEIHTGYMNANLLDYNYKLVPSAKASIKPLPRFIMNYQEGGPRAYQYGSYFIKAGRGWYDGETIKNARPITLMAVTSAKEAQEAVEDFGKLWDIARKYDNLADNLVKATRDIQEAGIKHLNVFDGQDLLDLVRTKDNPKGILDLTSEEYRPRITRHGEEIVYNNGRKSIAEPEGIWNDPSIELMNNSWVFGKGRRTKLLKDLYNRPAALKSFKEMTAKSIQRAANAGVWADYKRYMETIFRRNFSEVIDTQNGRYNPNAISDTTLIKTAKILPETAVADPELKEMTRAAQRFQDVYNISTNVRTDGDRIIRNYMDNLSQKLLKSKYISPELAENIAETDPNKAIRGIAFAAAMGFWNTAQGWKQMLGAVQAFAGRPIEGTRAILSYIPIRAMYRYKDSHPTFYKAFRKAAASLGMYDEKALDGLMEYMDSYGTLSATKRLPGVDEARRAGITNTKLWKSSYFFTEMGTNFNYGVTDTMAFMEKWAKKAGKLTKKDLTEIAARADDLYINMSRTTQSKLQNSTIGSWVTQWLSYPSRMMESMLNRRLTAGERIRMAAAQIGMWGVGGTFLDEETRLAAYDWLTNDVGVDDTSANILINGYVTYLGREAGVEINEGLSILDLFKNQFLIYHLLADQELVLPKVPAGNFLGVIGSVFNAVHDLVFPDTGNFNTLVYLRKRATDKTLPTGLRNAAKTALMLHIERAYNNAGEVVKKDITTRDAVMQMLGFNPKESSEMYYFKMYDNAEKEAIEDYVAKLKPYLDEMYMLSVAKDEDKEQNAARIADLNNQVTEEFGLYYNAMLDTWGAESAERFMRAYSRAYLSDMDEDKLQKMAERAYLINERKLNTIKGFMRDKEEQ